jgi:hypothetical protein
MIHPDALEAGPYPDGKPWWATIRVASLAPQYVATVLSYTARGGLVCYN